MYFLRLEPMSALSAVVRYVNIARKHLNFNIRNFALEKYPIDATKIRALILNNLVDPGFDKTHEFVIHAASLRSYSLYGICGTEQ